MRIRTVVLAVVVSLFAVSVSAGSSAGTVPKKKIFVVSSYHADYAWSQETNRGFCAALSKYGYFDNEAQIAEYTRSGSIETSRAVIKKVWMDAKRRTDSAELTKTTLEIAQLIRAFKPDIIFLGDDEAGSYIGNQFLDTKIPIVFWGFNDNPVKYGLVDSKERPGHNVTGVYQSGYYLENLQLLKRLVPKAKTFAILTDDSPSGRAHQKGIEFLARRGVLPLKLVETVETNDFALWKSKALELQNRVDAFFVTQYSTLKDENGRYVPNIEVARWYIENIRVPETTLGFFVKQGLLCGVDDSGFKQAYEAVVMAQDILTKGMDPATYAPRTPSRGALRVNRERAGMLGISLTADQRIEEYVDVAEALQGGRE